MSEINNAIWNLLKSILDDPSDFLAEELPADRSEIIGPDRYRCEPPSGVPEPPEEDESAKPV